MRGKFMNIYVIVSILMVIALLFHFNAPFLSSYKDVNKILEEMDFTGLTGTFRTTFLIMNIVILLVCALIGTIIIDERGINVNYNKILVILFIVLSVVPFISYIMIREEEKNQVQELYEETEIILGGTIDLNNKKHVKLLEKHSSALKTDPFFARKMQIIGQLKNGKSSTIIQAIGEFLFYPIMKEWDDGYKSASIKDIESYYAIFPGYTYINIIGVIFYFITSRSKTNDKEEVQWNTVSNYLEK